MAYTLDLISDREQLRELWQLDQSEYCDSNIDFESFSEWWGRYDLGLKVVTSGVDIVGAVGCWGLSERQCRQFIGGQITESQLQPLRVSELEQSPSRFWYVSGIISAPKLRRTLGGPLRRLLTAGMGSCAMSPHVRFPCDVYAMGYSSEGVAMLERFGFEVIKSSSELPDSLPLYWHSFESIGALRGALRQ